jgi:hypothetical protein
VQIDLDIYVTDVSSGSWCFVDTHVPYVVKQFTKLTADFHHSGRMLLFRK